MFPDLNRLRAPLAMTCGSSKNKKAAIFSLPFHFPIRLIRGCLLMPWSAAVTPAVASARSSTSNSLRSRNHGVNLEPSALPFPGALWDFKSDPATICGWREQKTLNGIHQPLHTNIVVFHAAFEVGKFTHDLLIHSQRFPHADERSNDKDAHSYGPL